MGFFYLNKINFFKKKNSSENKSKKIPPKQKEEKDDTAQRFFKLNPFLFLIFYVLVISYLLSSVSSKKLPLLEPGQIAPKDIVAPTNLSIEDKETTEKRRVQAAEDVLPVYVFATDVFFNIEEKIREFFNDGRKFIENRITSQEINNFKQEVVDKYGIELSLNEINSLIRLKFAAYLEDILVNAIGKVSEKGIIATKNLFIRGEEERGLTLIKGQSEKTVHPSDILDIKEAKELLTEEINSLEIAENEKKILIRLSHLFISPNLNFSNTLTDVRMKQAQESVNPVFYSIKKGKMIIRKGDEVTPETIKQIEIINANLQRKSGWWKNLLGTFLLFGLLFITLWYYIKSVLGKDTAFKNFNMIGTTLILSLLIYKFSVFLADLISSNSDFFLTRHSESLYYAIPLQLGVLLFAFLTRIHTSLVYTIFNSLLLGYMFNLNFDFILFSLLGGFAAIYGIKYYGKKNRTSLFKAGIFLVAPINIFVIIILNLIREGMNSWEFFISETLMGFIGGILSAVLAFLMLPLFETVFGIITQNKLLELTNSDLPIFKQMAIKAPGTYHHSLIVASLAETAAEKLKLDPMIVKAGALYHDIGKLKMPEYFSENKSPRFDIHKALKPSMSTLVIVNHVKEGLEKAKKLKLPQKIREIIEQHHGNSLVKYFFEKAKEEYDPEMHKIGEENYRYNHPRPKSKEAALIMLADSVEAASRSLKSPTKTNIRHVINEIFNNYIQDRQLDESDFSLKELRLIADSFLKTLYTIYHHRVEYPGFNFEGKKEKKEINTKKDNSSNDRNNK